MSQLSDGNRWAESLAAGKPAAPKVLRVAFGVLMALSLIAVAVAVPALFYRLIRNHSLVAVGVVIALTVMMGAGRRRR